jgi:hypothetical protein
MIKQSKIAWPMALMLKGIFITGIIALLFSMSGRDSLCPEERIMLWLRG